LNWIGLTKCIGLAQRRIWNYQFE